MNAADEKKYGHWTVNQLRAQLGRRGAKNGQKTRTSETVI